MTAPHLGESKNSAAGRRGNDKPPTVCVPGGGKSFRRAFPRLWNCSPGLQTWGIFGRLRKAPPLKRRATHNPGFLTRQKFLPGRRNFSWGRALQSLKTQVLSFGRRRATHGATGEDEPR